MVQTPTTAMSDVSHAQLWTTALRMSPDPSPARCAPLWPRSLAPWKQQGAPGVAPVKHSALTAASSECLPDILRMTLS